MKRALLIGGGLLVLALPAAAQAFTPNDPLLPRQWYAPQDKAFDAFNALTFLPTVRVAVIDSGVDVNHPDLKGQILQALGVVEDGEGDTVNVRSADHARSRALRPRRSRAQV